MSAETQHEGTLPRPGPIGRAVRLLLGLAVLYFFAGIVADLPELADGINLANPLAWLGLGFVFYAIPEVAGMPFSRSWSARQVRLGVSGLLVLTAAADLVLGGNPNGGAFGITFGLLLALVLGVVGASHVVAAVAAVPG